MYWIRSYCAYTKSVAKSSRICGNIKYYTFITSENVPGKRINNINWQCLLYVLNNKFFSNPSLNVSIMKGHKAWRLVIQWLSVLLLDFLYRVIQKSERKGTEMNESLVFGLNYFYSIFEILCNTGTSKYESSYVSSCSINANKFSWIYLPFLSLAYISVLQVTRGTYFIWQITFVPSCPHLTKCVGCRPVVYVIRWVDKRR
jgi:hypothetical protein